MSESITGIYISEIVDGKTIPGLSIDEALRRYRAEQKAKQQVRQGPKLNP